MTIQLPEKVKEVIAAMQKSGYQCYAVGGAVRDFLLSRESHDWDFATNATPEQIREVFPESFYDNKFGTVGVKRRNSEGKTTEIFEITPYRLETTYSDSRHPDSVRWGKTIEEDLRRRDFTVDAMAVTVDPQSEKLELVDPFKGRSDLEVGIIRAVGTADDRFSEDALRLIRAVRIATQLKFTIEEKTWQAISKNAFLITKISGERIRDELVKILSSDYSADGIRILYNAGLLEFILPELVKGVGVSQKGTHHPDDVFEHSLKSLAHCPSKNWVVRLAALIHDIGKPVTYKEREGKATFYSHEVVGARIARDIANRLHFSKEDREKLYMLTRWHMFSTSELLTDAAIRRFIRRVGAENTTDMIDIRIGDRLGSGTRATSWRLEEFKKRVVQVQQHIPSVSDLKVNGRDVMAELGIGPGPKVGQILKKLFEEITEDPAKNVREYLLGRIRELA